MSQSSKKRFILGLILLLIEALCFIGLGILCHIQFKVIVVFALIYFYILTFFDHFNFSPELIWQEVLEMLKAHALYGGIALMIGLLFDLMLCVKIFGIALLMFFIDLFLARTFRITLRQYATKVLIVGADSQAEDFTELIYANRFLFIDVVGYVNLGNYNGRKLSQDERIQEKLIPIHAITQTIEEKKVEEVYIVDDTLTLEQLEPITNGLVKQVPVIKYKPLASVLQPYNTKVEDMDGTLFVKISDAKKRYLDMVIKKIIDILAGIAGCIILIPLTLFVKIAFLLGGDHESIFFTQPRIGLDGQIIRIYKYRSMVPNAERILEELMEKDPAIKEEYLRDKKLENDPRITKVGNILRKTSLDEFPQFLNVLKGDMSFIGPRPYLEREIPDMDEYYYTIIKSKPGITGMWQANGRSNISFQERCKLDEYYYQNWSISLDIIIIIKTIKAVLFRDGAK